MAIGFSFVELPIARSSHLAPFEAILANFQRALTWFRDKGEWGKIATVKLCVLKKCMVSCLKSH
jgi:hypothetical protein